MQCRVWELLAILSSLPFVLGMYYPFGEYGPTMVAGASGVMVTGDQAAHSIPQIGVSSSKTVANSNSAETGNGAETTSVKSVIIGVTTGRPIMIDEHTKVTPTGHETKKVRLLRCF